VIWEHVSLVLLPVCFGFRASDFEIGFLMVHPRFASTAVLVRPESSGGFEILLTRRPLKMRFLGGYYVFPGGTVHSDDYNPTMLSRCRGLSGKRAREILDGGHEPEEALGHWVAAFREIFEEVGLLLCVTEKGETVRLHESPEYERFELARQKIVTGDLKFENFLVAESLFCDLARMRYFDHWVTPDIYSMRFDTRFYIAAIPDHQIALTRSEEVSHSLWITARDALTRMDRRTFPILPPTTTVLHRLAGLSSWERLRTEFELS
jgi:8-oxo-dGTP pyrophosphatase MutT (NUDIX family)